MKRKSGVRTGIGDETGAPFNQRGKVRPNGGHTFPLHEGRETELQYSIISSCSLPRHPTAFTPRPSMASTLELPLAYSSSSCSFRYSTPRWDRSCAKTFVIPDSEFEGWSTGQTLVQRIFAEVGEDFRGIHSSFSRRFSYPQGVHLYASRACDLSLPVQISSRKSNDRSFR